MNQNIIQKSKEYFLSMAGNTSDVDLKQHVIEAEKWARKLLKKYPEADETVLLSAVWLHDIGYFVGEKEIDHAIKSEKEADQFLSKFKTKTDKNLVKQILHCIRAHRNKEVKPETFEARLLVCLDSASHLTGSLYFSLLDYGRGYDFLLKKLERDFKDLGIFPEIQKKLKPVYEDWKKLLNDLKNIEL